MTYNGYHIEAVPANEKPYHFYRDKAEGYTKVAYSLERRAKRAGRNSALYKSYIRMLETANKYDELGQNAWREAHASK